MTKKIYKVYAQCVVRPRGKAITEITESEAHSLIMYAVNDMVDEGTINIETEDSDEFGRMLDEISSNAIEFFEENDFFECGDFIVLVSDDYPERRGSYGWTHEF